MVVLCVVWGYQDGNLELLLGNMSLWVWEVKILFGRCCVCNQGILKCKRRIVNCKYVTVDVAGNNFIWLVLCVCVCVCVCTGHAAVEISTF